MKDKIVVMIVIDTNNIDEIFEIFHKRIGAIIKKTIIAIPAINIKPIGATEFPSKSVADDKTDKRYVPMPKIARVLFFIGLIFLISPTSD